MKELCSNRMRKKKFSRGAVNMIGVEARVRGRAAPFTRLKIETKLRTCVTRSQGQRGKAQRGNFAKLLLRIYKLYTINPRIKTDGE